MDFKKEVGTANLSCGGGPWCNSLPAGSQTVTYGSDG
ncbi:hypothetical protein LEP1GSC175_3373, partial [Leptospira santarosai str. HAI821]